MERRTKPTIDISKLGKLPPQAPEMEMAILGTMMTERNSIDEVVSILSPEMFYVDANQIVFEAIMSLYEDSNPIDMVTVNQELTKMGKIDQVGGIIYLMDLSDKMLVGTSLEYHARVIAQKFMQRKMIQSCSKTITDCYDDTGDIFNIISELDSERDIMLDKVISRKEVTNLELSRSTISELKKSLNPVGGLTGIASGLRDIDKLTGGWQKGDLIVLAARPSMGKSALAMVFALNATGKFNKPSAFFSLEMSNNQLMSRQLSIHTGIELSHFIKKKFSEYEMLNIEKAHNEISGLNIIWDDTPSLSITEFTAKCRKFKRKYGIELVVVDYLQLMTVGRDKKMSRDQEVGLISRSLKSIAKELDIAVIALSQLSRNVESRPNKRPMLSDLRESGSIEQDADMVCFLYRPEYYKIKETAAGTDTHGLAEFIIAKHRNGAVDDVELKFINKTTNFVDMEIINSDTMSNQGVILLNMKDEIDEPF